MELKLSFIDKNGLTEESNTLKITYPYASATFNLGDGTVAYATGEAVRTIANIAPAAATTDAFTTDYVLAPTVAGKIPGLKFQLNAEEEKTIAETAIKANVKTKITGEYQPIPTPAAVGDFYMKDGTWLPGATTLTSTQQADCIGIVYWTGDPTVNDATLKAAHPTCTHGLVVALKEDGTTKWNTNMNDVNYWIINNTPYLPITGPISNIMGYNNTKAIEAFDLDVANSENKADVIDKVTAYRTAVPTPTGNSGWFLPSLKELTLLCGLDNQDADVSDESFGTGNRDTINTQLAKITGSTQISTNVEYWSSTQENDSYAWYVNFTQGNVHSREMNNRWRARVVSAF